MNRLALLLSVLLTTSLASAEVCAVLDADDIFEKLDVVTDEKVGLIWTKVSSRPDEYCLNIDGDRLGDQAPTWAVILLPDLPLLDRRFERPALRVGQPDPEETPTPVLVWPRNDGNDWELIYSMWNYETGAWNTALYIERLDNDDDDESPSLVVTDNLLELTWRRVTDDETYFMYAQGTLVSVGPTYDIYWSEPIILEVEGPGIGVTTQTPGGGGPIVFSSAR